MKPNLLSILDVAVEAALEAGRITLEYFQTSSLVVYTKSDQSPVTIADRAAESRIIEIVRDHFPSHSIIGEESGESVGSEPYQWIIDPIDGTKSFINGVPLYGVMIGVAIDGVPSVGVVHFPALGDMHTAARGHGSHWNGRPAKVSDRSSLDEARLLTTSPKSYGPDPRKARIYAELERRSSLARGWGDCYGHMLVATGRADIMLDPKMSLWDCAALLPIIEEAGGRFTDWNGDARIDGGDAISTNAALHAVVMDVVRSSGANI
ncbi:MAG: histidinol-phosphatase [bacterium]|nr:histidinol-phosphatase [Candidatus Kapabacteria bacterium]